MKIDILLMLDFVQDWFKYNVWAKRPWRPGRKGTRFPNGIPRAEALGPYCAPEVFVTVPKAPWVVYVEDGDDSTKPFSPVVDLDLTDDEIKKFYGEL